MGGRQGYRGTGGKGDRWKDGDRGTGEGELGVREDRETGEGDMWEKGGRW